ncbi:hypothetical protein LTR64_008237 [Lithohypha guttulata]|uniref:uncharacterized protein n=1 Tax=Lithohypha guttulata TaxID=1690604 RepID=UPI002DE0FDEC|nr:hypothetical protein LTR51_008389 [Lithohypha guttulata]
MPFARIDGIEIHYTDTPPSSSNATSLTIVFVHGLGSTQNYYGPILPYLTRYRCVTFDNYGAGRSRYYSELHPDTSIEAIAGNVLGLMDHLAIDKAVVVGYSMGGMVPTTIASSNKGADRVIACVCIGPVHPSEQIAQIFSDRIKTVMEGGIETMANTIPNAATGPRTTVLQKSFIREMIMSQDPEGYCANCRAIATAKAPNYAGVTCPVYIIAGSVDKSAPASGCQFIHDQLVNSSGRKIDLIQEMGHWYCVEDPDLLGKMVAIWIAEVA